MKRKCGFKFVVFAMIMCICAMPVFLTGCVGGDDWEISGVEPDLAGIKVLRRPSQYDFTKTAFDDEQGDFVENYYGALSKNIFNNLLSVYLVPNLILKNSSFVPADNIFDALTKVSDNENVLKLNDWFGDGLVREESLKYFFDAARYQIVGQEIDGMGTVDEIDDQIVATVDLGKSWNWVKNNQEILPYNNDVLSFMYSTYKDEIEDQGNDTIKVRFKKDKFTEVMFKDHYYKNLTNIETMFNTQVLQDALTYAIYCIVLGEEVADMGFDASGKFVVDGYLPQGAKTSEQVALETIRTKFDKVGNYVGLTQNNQKELVEFVLNNVIGESVVDYNNPLQNLYYEDVVPAVVEYSLKTTQIGTGENGDIPTTMDKNFVAGEIVDYPGSAFYSSLEDDPLGHIESCEYQSMLIMPEEDLYISDIWLEFAYDAKDADGNIIDESNVDLNNRQYLDIIASVRYWNGEEILTIDKSIRVYNGHYQAGEDCSMIEFEMHKDMWGNNIEGGFRADVGAFEDPIPVATGNTVESEMLNGLNTKRHNYELKQFKNDFGYLPGGIGVINNENFVKDDQGKTVPYLEIAFRVDKTQEKNYDFKVGIMQLYSEDVDKYDDILNP